MLGHDIVADADAVRAAVSLTGELASVDEDLTGREKNLVLLARLLGFDRAGAKARAAELLEAFDLVDAAARLVKNYSGRRPAPSIAKSANPLQAAAANS